MAVEIVMPALEMAQETAVLLRWHKKEGDYVQKGEVLMEVETDKAAVEIEATGSGILSQIACNPGDRVLIGQVIALILEKGEQLPPEGKPSMTTSQPHHEPAIRKSELGQGHDELSPGIVTSLRQVPSEKRISPKARRLALEHGVNLDSIVASAPGQAEQSADVSKFLHNSGVAAVPSGDYIAVPLQGNRKLIAEKTQKSHQTAPHIFLSLSIDVTEIYNISRDLSPKVETAPPCPSLTSFLLKHPRLNAHLVGNEIREYKDIHLGVAVAVEDGVVVVVIRDAGRKSTLDIWRELQDLVIRSRNGRLRPTEVTGSTFTVSNLGMFGIERFSAILNIPEVAILSLGCSTKRAVEVGEKVEFRLFLEATINVDHRAIDGAGAAKYLQTLKQLLEQPEGIARV
jgi:pyruvate dehydrogenase E2 component (dihydrolipoamide acetyltransferase)